MTDTPDDRIYHLTTRTEWEEARTSGTYRRSTRDRSFEQVGFVHCSLPDQLRGVAEMVYADCHEDLVVLELSLATLEESGLPVRLEDAGNGTLYPHVYAPLPCSLVREVWPYDEDDDSNLTR